jgi:hypothetical protein
MMEGMRDDALSWANFTPEAHSAEVERMRELFPDPKEAQALLDFGVRPYGRMEVDPYNQLPGYTGPWAPSASDITDEPLLVDTQSGWRYRVPEPGGPLHLDLEHSDNFLDIPR